MRRILAATAATVCLTALTAGAAPAAYAGRLVHDDARRDVIRLEFTDQDVKESVVRQRLDPDIRRITIDYRQGALVIRTKYAALERLVGRSEFTEIQTRDNAFGAQVQVNRRGRWQGSTLFMSAKSEGQNICPAAKHRFDYEANVSIWTIPPTCLGRAPWVKVGQSAMHFGGKKVFLDYAFANGSPHRRPISARVWRG